MFSVIQNMLFSGEAISPQLEFYLLNCFNIIKEVCKKPPKSLISLNELPGAEVKSELLYLLLDYFIILDEKEIFERVFYSILNNCNSSVICYKYYVVLKKFSIKYFNNIRIPPGDKSKKRMVQHNLISEFIDNSDYVEVNIDSYSDESFRKFIEFSLSALKTNIKEEESIYTMNYFLTLFSKGKAPVSKELDGTNIMDFFTILNISDSYSTHHLNNVAVFSVSYELLKFLYTSLSVYVGDNNIQNGVGWAIKEIKSVLHTYCIRIFDQSENYLESNKNKTVIDKYIQYNLNLIEACVWESLKIINLICKLDNSIVSNTNMRMKQVYERIVLKQSGLVFLEILQFFIENCNLIIIDLDYYVSEFFKLKLKYNYKNEILSFTTLDFLYKNKEILDQKTQVFNSFFPLIIKIFATFPKYLNTKFFLLIDYMTKPSTVMELFNHILDLPAIILIIENFECLTLRNEISSGLGRINIEEVFQPDYGGLITFLLRDEAYGKENISSFNINVYDKQLKKLFDSLVFTSRVHSTTKIVPKLMKKFFDVIIQRDESESALETIILIFERFSHFHENEHYKQEIRNLLIRKCEEIFKKWPNLVTQLRERILYEVSHNYSNSTKRELICLLTWSLGEFLNIESKSSYSDTGIKETFECLENLLRDKIKSANPNKKDVNAQKSDEAMLVEDLLNCK
jgi:hypothetical protein